MKNRIKEFLDQRGLTAYRMIKDTDLSQNTVYNLVRDPSTLPSMIVLEKICDTYGVPPGDLLHWEPKEAQSKYIH